MYPPSLREALTLLNDEFVLHQARLFADRLKEAAPDDPSKQVDLAYRIALTRQPDEKELAIWDAVRKTAVPGRFHARADELERIFVRKMRL